MFCVLEAWPLSAPIAIPEKALSWARASDAEVEPGTVDVVPPITSTTLI